ncbi:TerD family protein [Chryseobacterium geocarposphaerae]|uniref:Tellurium resistance protein TerZ n=1 Tax=Chryseobacterium geocarposphaerae TaxID=1416776 RepID=A0A2M9C778_9FLAO|nr:TerD family protein [Chryseobacterium geocarposphaerae]PJJ66687.1 tellurium resistance protein TerZ [Chryseobacterium geocarposphaerae]
MLNLKKGDFFSLKKNTGQNLTDFCLGVSWSKVKLPLPFYLSLFNRKSLTEIDLELTCIMLDKNGNRLDWIHSPKYNSWLIQNNFPLGKLSSKDEAFKHQESDNSSLNNSDKKLIKINLEKINTEIDQIFFYLHINPKRINTIDFSLIPSVTVHIFEGNIHHINKTYCQFEIPQNNDSIKKGTLLVGRLLKTNNEWKFEAIGKGLSDKKYAMEKKDFEFLS